MSGVLFLLFGVVYIPMGLWLGWLGLPLVWLGASCTVVGLAYLSGTPRLMGKCQDGTLPAAWLVLLPFLALVWLSWQLRRCRSEPCWHEVHPGLFLGRMAVPTELPPGVGLVVDLTCELVEPASIRRGDYRCLPTLDGCAPEQSAFLEVVREVAAFERPVFIHCAAGHGRSATLVAAVLITRAAAPAAEAAERMLRLVRPGVSLTPAQRKLLERFAVLRAMPAVAEADGTSA